jgi:collagenase-like PrtC family protease
MSIPSFSVATNFEPDLLPALVGLPVAELFGKLPSDSIGGGRASFMLARTRERQLKAHVADAARRGIGFNYLINPACLDNREFTRKGIRDIERTLEFAEAAGCTAVTISLPSLLPLIKNTHPRLKVRVGVYARVDSVSKARYWEELGADCITLESLSVNRDFRLLESIRKAVGLNLQLIVNANCRLFCPLSGQHMVNLSHASQAGHRSRGFMVDWCALRCSWDKMRDPANYLRSEFIRPEDLRIYQDLGYSSFKILERGAPTGVLAKRVRAYSEGRFDGNLLDLIQPYGYKRKTVGGTLDFLRYFFRPGQVRMDKLLRVKRLAEMRGMLKGLGGEPVYIDNRALAGYIEGFKNIDCRRADCADCGHCADFASKAVRVDKAYRGEILKLYDEAFSDMDSGALWR